MKRKHLVLMAGILFGVSLVSGQSFEAFRLKSGMTPEQVAHAYPSYEFRWTGQSHSGSGGAMLVRAKGFDILATLSFCHNSLVGVIRNIDPDTDFIRYLDERLKEFGQPQVSVRREAWTGPGGGDIESVDFTWIHNGVKYTVSFVPEGRTGSGKLRHLRNASASVFLVTTPCMTKNQ